MTLYTLSCLNHSTGSCGTTSYRKQVDAYQNWKYANINASNCSEHDSQARECILSRDGKTIEHQSH